MMSFNLRPANSGASEVCLLTGYLPPADPSLGYPPSGNGVREFLAGGSSIKAEEAPSLVRNFLFALFEKTTQAVKDFGGDKGTRIRKFRDSMSTVQHMEPAGSYRVEFYGNDIGKARKVCHRFLSSYFLTHRFLLTVLQIT